MRESSNVGGPSLATRLPALLLAGAFLLAGVEALIGSLISYHVVKARVDRMASEGNAEGFTEEIYRPVTARARWGRAGAGRTAKPDRCVLANNALVGTCLLVGGATGRARRVAAFSERSTPALRGVHRGKLCQETVFLDVYRPLHAE